MDFLESDMMPDTDATSSNPAWEDTVLTAEKLKEIATTMRSIPDATRDWMIEKGFDPAKGGRLVLPITMVELVTHPPEYIQFSYLVEGPLLINLQGFDIPTYRPVIYTVER